jgi:hypothetical protein
MGAVVIDVKLWRGKSSSMSALPEVEWVPSAQRGLLLRHTISFPFYAMSDPLSSAQLTTTLHLSRSSAAKYDFTFKKYQAAS